MKYLHLISVRINEIFLMKSLIDKYLKGALSHDEREKLISWVSLSADNLEFFKSYINSQTHVLPINIDKNKAFENFLVAINQKKRRRKYQWLSVACLLLILLSVGLIKTNLLSDDTKLSSNEIEDIRQIQITFADGNKQSINKDLDIKFIDSLGKTIASKKNHIISFDTNDKRKKSNGNIRIDIPYGEKFRLKLSDGTMVWLNSGSSLSFPERFNPKDKKREVTLVGEAFFEVTSNKDNPFIVQTSEINIKAIGTQFNISNYKDDSTIKTTLNEGKVTVYHSIDNQKRIELLPNEQVEFRKSSKEFKKKKVDSKLYNSWIDNKIILNHMKFSKLVQVLERKYNVEIINKVKDLENNIYQGEFNDESLIETLETIAISAEIDYIIKGNKILLIQK